MFKTKELANAVRFALLGGAVATAMTSLPVLAAEGEEVERIEVTGSRIKRTDMEGALPVTVFDKATMEVSGHASVSDFLRNTSFNSFGSFRPQSGNSAQGVATINLRGLGTERTLVLVNGKRAPKTPSTGNSVDLNTIPMAAVERIELLTDGASAVYGSDAIAGVVNIIMKKDFEGVQLMLGGQNPNIPSEGGDVEEGALLMGATSDKGFITASASFNKRDIIYARALPWSSEGYSVYSNNFTTIDDNGDDKLDWEAVPDACQDPNFLLDEPFCFFNFSAVSADEAETKNMSLFVNGEYELSDNITGYANSTISRATSFGRYAPVPDKILVSADSPNNPYDEDRFLWHRFASLGNRDNDTENNVYDIVLGAKGMVGPVDLDGGVHYTESKFISLGKNYLVRKTASDYINDGTYDIFDPDANDIDVLNAMKATTSRDSVFKQKEAYLSGGFDVVDIASGTIQSVVGIEWRNEEFSDQYDSLSEAGQIGGSSGNSAADERTVKSAYAEVLVPVLEQLELNVAARYDDYSDFGSEISPKGSLRWTPLDELVLRASYGEGFRAPTLDVISAKTSFSAASVNDDQHCEALGKDEGCSAQVDSYVIANPDLVAELSDQISFGVAYEPLDWLSTSVDYYGIEIEDRIAFISAQELVDREIAGDPIPLGLGISRTASGAIREALTGYRNDGTLETSGIDFNVRTSFELPQAFGSLSNNLQLGYVLDYTVDGGRDEVGDPGVPEMRGQLQNIWAVSDFEFGWVINYIADTAYEVEDGDQLGHTPSWITHDLSASYNSPWNGKITIGAQNVTDKAPPLNPNNEDGRQYDFNLYNGYGRVLFARYVQSF